MILTSVSAFNLLIRCFGWRKCVGNQPHIDSSLEKWHPKCYSNSILREFFVPIPKSTNGSFLKISFNVESETVSLNFSCFVILKFSSLFCTLSGSFTHSWIYNIMRRLFEKYWFTKFCKSSKFDTFYYARAKKSQLLISPSISSEKF